MEKGAFCSTIQRSRLFTVTAETRFHLYLLLSHIPQGKKTKEVDFYRKFIRTANFVNWFKTRKRNATFDISNHYLSILDPSKVTSLVKVVTTKVTDSLLPGQVGN
jgi:hypothetical protein